MHTKRYIYVDGEHHARGVPLEIDGTVKPSLPRSERKNRNTLYLEKAFAFVKVNSLSHYSVDVNVLVTDKDSQSTYDSHLEAEHSA